MQTNKCADSTIPATKAQSRRSYVFSRRSPHAYSAMTPYALADVNTLDRARVSARNSRMQLEQFIGSSVGYEFIRSEKVGDSLLKLVYIEKAEKQAIPWQFIFYKTGAGWALSAFSNSDNINTLFSR